MVDWYYIFSISPLGIYPSSQTIYNGSRKQLNLKNGDTYHFLRRVVGIQGRLFNVGGIWW
jgi:hypothetical protein